MTREISCTEAARFVYGYLDGELEPQSVEELEAHVAACRRCMGALEFERRVLEFVRRHAAGERTPASLRERVERLMATR